ncbi:hypothetical protein [Sulfurimonas sp.]|jgi:tetratricopeptide (TPR) repeat protein|uniref:tetratricopeptide repeat protein n=1 Tax=Sulfurimonas sp. TaxID=2022749 RepID=UPI0025F3496F|nr:hypothetical protein [Sulfurimonas sp.]MBT5934422.1 hypothetical protein [Sulfurimonas sp.]
MFNTTELEKQWLQYKIKSYIPYLIISLSLLIIILIVYFFKFDMEKSSTNIQTSIIKSKPNPKKEIVQIKPSPHILVEDNKKVQLLPSLDFMKKMQNASQLHRPTVKSIQRPHISDIRPKEETKHAKRKKIIQDNIEELPQESKKDIDKTINIERKNTQKDIYDIIKRFKKNNNPVLSLFIAKKYYELGNYKQAYNYALITNEINKDIDDSWIIFTKSLVKLGNKDKALDILKQYIEHSHSNSAKILRKEIQSGKFK